MEKDILHIGERKYSSRLLLGSSRYPSPDSMIKSIQIAEVELVTVSIRRVNVYEKVSGDVLSLLRKAGVDLLPNTAGCYTAKEAILTAELAREALETNLIKLEVIADDETLLPDTEQTVEAASKLMGLGFDVMAYCNDDPVACRKLAGMGCVAVMPLASPIGSGMGILNAYNLRLIRSANPDVALFVDAGIGTASDAAKAMELGYDGVLLNTAVAQAEHPVQMALAMKKAVEAGRLAYLAGRMTTKHFAEASSPETGKIEIEKLRENN